MSWPSIIKPSIPLEEETIKAQLRTEFEAGYVHSRARDTRARTRWNLKWKSMSETDYQTLKSFFESNVGGSFTWTHPVSSASYTVRFTTEVLTGHVPLNGRREVAVGLEEV